jgi:ABC-2 type transport system permease protein
MSGRAPGWWLVARKEIADHLGSVRLVLLLVLMALAGLAAVSSASGPIRDAADASSETPSVFLLLFELSPERVPSFSAFIGILGPLLGIVFGFDAINGERSQRTLPRLVAQPIHRDDVLLGKYVAGLAVITAVLVSVTMIVAGYGILRLGILPSATDLVRLAAFLLVAVVYIGLWLGLAVVASVVAQRAATAALAVLAIWLVLTIFWGLIAGIVADAVHPVSDDDTVSLIDNSQLELRIRRVSPDQLFTEAASVLLTPTRQQIGIITTAPDERAIPTALDLPESLRLAWWQVAVLAGATVVTFAVGYRAFIGQEIRA